MTRETTRRPDDGLMTIPWLTEQEREDPDETDEVEDEKDD